MRVPSYLSTDLFQKALKEYFKDEKLQIVSVHTEDAIPEGENYTSDLFRTKMVYKKSNSSNPENMSVIVKVANEDGGVKEDIAKKLNMFGKEAEMFTKTFPAMYDILGEYFTLCSKCIYATLNPHSIIILEDLTTLGFDVLPRHLGFDLEHCFLCVEKLAQMHAASVIMYEKDPSLLKLYPEGLYADKPLVREWVAAGFKGLIDASSRWPGYEKYSYKLQALGQEAIERGLQAQKRRLGGFNVLNHGDLWCNNMMFRYNKEGKLQDVRFIDFQMNIFTSPAIDLHYFLGLSTNVEVKIYHFDILLDHYYAQLIANLAKMQYSLERVPTREQFKHDYNSRAFYGLMGAATVLAFVKTDKGRKDASFENIIKDDSKEGFRYHSYNNERYRKHMEHLLPYYDSLGILD